MEGEAMDELNEAARMAIEAVALWPAPRDEAKLARYSLEAARVAMEKAAAMQRSGDEEDVEGAAAGHRV